VDDLFQLLGALALNRRTFHERAGEDFSFLIVDARRHFRLHGVRRLLFAAAIARALAAVVRTHAVIGLAVPRLVRVAAALILTVDLPVALALLLTVLALPIHRVHRLLGGVLRGLLRAGDLLRILRGGLHL